MIRVPATSANLGPGFDALGLAVTLYADVGVVGDEDMPEGAEVASGTHPAQVAFAAAGGVGQVWVRTNIPMGRGLGFSGAVRVGGVVAAEVQQHGVEQWLPETSRALELGTELEGHADNVAASLYGGIVATANDRAIRIPSPLQPAFVAWVPSFTTSTNESRTKLGSVIAFDDAVFNIGRTALLVAAFAAGDVSALRTATEDRMHQEVRFSVAQRSREALEAGLAANAWCGWLSGSGPTVALLCDRSSASDVAAALPDDAVVKILEIDQEGARIGTYQL
jgi:homoserine kinase